VELARRYGDRLYELTMMAGIIAPLIEVGRWDEALARADEIRQSQDIAGLQTVYIELMPVLFVLFQRGDVDAAAEMMKTFEPAEHTEDIQVRGLYLWLRALMLAGEGRHEEALAHAERSMRSEVRFSSAPSVVASFAIAVEAALALSQYDRAAEIVAEVEATQPGHVSPALRAQWSRLSALLAAARGDEERVEPGFKAAAGLFRELGMPFWLAVSLLQHGEWLASTGRLGDAEPQLAEAREIFERLQARPWLERLAMTAGPIGTGALA
jgi:tetratricopeptide (TPR) repeat protein